MEPPVQQFPLAVHVPAGHEHGALPHPLIGHRNVVLPGPVSVRNGFTHDEFVQQAPRAIQFPQFRLAQRSNAEAALVDLLHEADRCESIQRLPHRAAASGVALLERADAQLLAGLEMSFEDVLPELLEDARSKGGGCRAIGTVSFSWNCAHEMCWLRKRPLAADYRFFG